MDVSLRWSFAVLLLMAVLELYSSDDGDRASGRYGSFCLTNEFCRFNHSYCHRMSGCEVGMCRCKYEYYYARYGCEKVNRTEEGGLCTTYDIRYGRLCLRGTFCQTCSPGDKEEHVKRCRGPLSPGVTISASLATLPLALVISKLF